MAFMEIVVVAWVCDGCGLEAIVADNNLPEGWTLSADAERHACALCVPVGSR